MEFLEIPLFDDDVYKLVIRFILNGLFLLLLLRFAILPNQREREFAFSIVMMNITVFFICFTLKKLDIGLGMALGLFAIFGILRYRADAIRTKEMTYLFIVIAIAVINALSNKKTSYLELFLVNFTILGVALLKETILFRASNKENELLEAEARPKAAPKPKKFLIKYDRLEWLAPERQQDLLADLKTRTGLDFNRVKIQDIDLPSQSATLQAWMDKPADSPTPSPFDR